MLVVFLCLLTFTHNIIDLLVDLFIDRVQNILSATNVAFLHNMFSISVFHQRIFFSSYDFQYALHMRSIMHCVCFDHQLRKRSRLGTVSQEGGGEDVGNRI